MSTTKTRWGEVSFKVQPDDDGSIHLMLDGSEYTFECELEALVALRLGQALMKLARIQGLPAGTFDP
jgi:hypothetical protein